MCRIGKVIAVHHDVPRPEPMLPMSPRRSGAPVPIEEVVFKQPEKVIVRR